jgi:tetratricopeptide (TPR) repeat protein
MNLARRALFTLLAVVAAAPANSMPASPESIAAEARLDAEVARCSKLPDLVSCYAALSMKPNDPGLLAAEGDALVQLRRPGEAIGVYRNAIRSGGVQDVLSQKIAVAEQRRRFLLDECETQAGPAASRACESAWLPGAPDEVMVFKRRGLLLQNDNQPGASLDAYMAAARLAPRDRDVARAVVALSGSTERSDAPTLTARGAALMTLGRPADAILSFREALRLAPDLADAKARLRIAEGALASQRRTSATVAASPPTPRDAGGQADGAFSNEAPVTRSN